MHSEARIQQLFLRLSCEQETQITWLRDMLLLPAHVQKVPTSWPSQHPVPRIQPFFWVWSAYLPRNSSFLTSSDLLIGTVSPQYHYWVPSIKHPLLPEKRNIHMLSNTGFKKDETPGLNTLEPSKAIPARAAHHLIITQKHYSVRKVARWWRRLSAHMAQGSLEKPGFHHKDRVQQKHHQSSSVTI